MLWGCSGEGIASGIYIQPASPEVPVLICGRIQDDFPGKVEKNNVIKFIISIITQEETL